MVYKAKSNQQPVETTEKEEAETAQPVVKKETVVPQVVFQPIPATLSSDFQGLLKAMEIPLETQMMNTDALPFQVPVKKEE